jgi:hypothetical protein
LRQHIRDGVLDGGEPVDLFRQLHLLDMKVETASGYAETVHIMEDLVLIKSSSSSPLPYFFSVMLKNVFSVSIALLVEEIKEKGEEFEDSDELLEAIAIQ